MSLAHRSVHPSLAAHLRAATAIAAVAAVTAASGCSSDSTGQTGSGQTTGSSGGGSSGSSSSGSSSGGTGDAGATGHDAGSTHKCSGSPTPCNLLTQSQCAATAGCSIAGSCTGFATSCFDYNGNSSLCIEQQGCVWDSGSSTCSGVADDCSLMTGSSECIFQSGCSWSESKCGGVALATCTGITQAACTSVPGCVWL